MIAWMQEHIWGNFGWYSGSELTAFELKILNVLDHDEEYGPDFIVIFSLQVLKFTVAFGWQA